MTDQVRLLESVEPVALEHWRDMTHRVDEEQLAVLLIRYGAKAFHVLKLLAQAPTLNRPICPHHDVLEVELVHAIQEEQVCTITDLLARRTRIAWSSCQGLDALSTVIGLFQHHAGLSDHQLEAQIDEYHRFLGQGLQFRHRYFAGPACRADKRHISAQTTHETGSRNSQNVTAVLIALQQRVHQQIAGRFARPRRRHVRANILDKPLLLEV